MSHFIAIDFETSGPPQSSACSVGLVRIVDGMACEEYQSLIRPPSSRVKYTWVHGLTWAMLKDARPFPDVLPDIAAFAEGAQGFVAHNASFDRNVLLGCCETFRRPAPAIPFYCTLKGARRTLDIPSKSLDAVCAYYGYSFNHHEALSDAKACAMVFTRLLESGLDVEQMRLGPRKVHC